MSVEPSNDVTWEGQIYYKQRATFAQYRLFWGMLCLESGRGPKRLDLYDRRCSPARRGSPTTTIPLTDVLHIDSRAARSNKHSFQVLATGSKFHFATKTAHERELWIKHLNSLLFGPPLPGIVYEFQVQVLSNSHADQLHLQGKYILKISSSEMALTCANGKLPTRFHCGLTEILRTRYTTFMDAGQQFSVLVIYTKGSSEVGEGTFVFRALSAADISRVIDLRVKELCQDSAVEFPSKTLNLSLPSSPPPLNTHSKTLPRSQSPIPTSPHHHEIFEIGRSKTASVPHKRLNISLDDSNSYVHFTKVAKGHLPLPDDSGYSASLDSSDFHRASLLPLNPLYRHLSSPDEPQEHSSFGEVLPPHGVSPLSEYHLADDPQTLRSVPSSSGTHENTGVRERYREEHVHYSPERQGLHQGDGGEKVDYVNVQRGFLSIQPVLEPVVKQSKPPIPLPRKNRPSLEQVRTSMSHDFLTGNHRKSYDDHVTSTENHVTNTEDHVSKGGGGHLIGGSSNMGPPTKQSYVNFTVLDPVEETENTTSEHTTEITLEDPASWISGNKPAQQRQHKISKGMDPSYSSVTAVAAGERPRAELAHSPLLDSILSDSDLDLEEADLEEAHHYLRILPPDTIPSSHTVNNASVTVAVDEQHTAESDHSPLQDPVLPDSDLDLEEMPHYLRILPPDTIPSSHTATSTSENNTVGRCHPDVLPVVPVGIQSPTSDLESSPHSGGNCDSPLWGDMDSNSESFQNPPTLESSKHGNHPPTFLSTAFQHVSLRPARSAEILPTLGSSLPVHRMYVHRLHSSNALPSASKQQCNHTTHNGEEHEDVFYKENMSQSRLVESLKSSSESDFMSLDQLNLNGQAAIPPLNQPRGMRPDHLDDVFEDDTELDDGYTKLLSLPEIDSDGYSKPKPPAQLPYYVSQSATRPSPFISPHQVSISHRPPAPLPHTEEMTAVVDLQPFPHWRDYHRSLTRVRSHSDGTLDRCSEIYEDQDIWYDYAKISEDMAYPIPLFNEIAGYCDINRQQPEDPGNQQLVLGPGYDPGNQQPVLGPGYDRLPLKTWDGPESSQISDLQVDQSDLSTSQVTAEPDWGESNGTDSNVDQSGSRTNVSQPDQSDLRSSVTQSELRSDFNQTDQSDLTSGFNETDQSVLTSGFNETDQSDSSSFNQTYHSGTNVNQTDESDSRTNVSNIDQSDSRTKKPPPVFPKPRRSNVNFKFETPV